MMWLAYTLAWYLMLLGIGTIFIPLSRRLFPRFIDGGYGLTKAIGVLLISYSAFVLGTVRIIPINQLTLYGIAAAWGGFNYYLHTRKKKHAKSDVRPSIPLIALEEGLFFITLVTWAYVRAHEPSINGLEKFMDFGFINSIVRGEYFPAQDMWLAGKSINYYYFGHLTAAILTKMNAIPAHITYNLVLAQLCALSVVGAFSLACNVAYAGFKKNMKLTLITGFLATFLTNFAGNLHTAYAFTSGYPNEEPKPLWELGFKFSMDDLSSKVGLLEKLHIGYWYPNATRFIPFTIHEFPLYSYVVADLHGHVFDIPFVLITLSLLFSFYISAQRNLLFAGLLGGMISIHLMTNAFSAPIYLALSLVIYAAVFGLSKNTLIHGLVTCISFIIINTPFTHAFESFATGVGFNCVPPGLSESLKGFLRSTPLAQKLLFEGNCQSSAWWMLATLWGFFWVNFMFLITHILRDKKAMASRVHILMLIIFAFSTLLISASEFVYAKDIYPTHFRANTMFKLGYQAFIMMSIACAYVFVMFKQALGKSVIALVYLVVMIPLLILVSLYPAFAIESYYKVGQGIHQKPELHLDGQIWLKKSAKPEYLEIIHYLNENVDGQPHILEAQGDSYTDKNIVSAYTGLPTVGGWYVHEWLWRGSPDAVGSLQADIRGIYQEYDVLQTREALRKYNVEYVIVGPNERELYTELDESKFGALGKVVYKSKVGSGTIYRIPVDTH